jgi:hypothetical protein
MKTVSPLAVRVAKKPLPNVYSRFHAKPPILPSAEDRALFIV